MPAPTLDAVRARFPALASGLAFLENAGGSQVPDFVSDAMHRYLRETYVQLGAGYELSRRCTATVEAAHAFARTFVGADGGHAILGSSTTALMRLLADCYEELLEPGDEIVLAANGHEANLGPWKRLERRGVVLRWWAVDPELQDCPVDALDALLNERTALVCLPHVSNLLGAVADLPAVVAKAHAVGARVVCDGVAYAPHRAIDVAAWNVDWYVYSTYKVYGPHMAVLYGSDDALAELPRPNHFFIPHDELPYQYEPGGPSHEACAGLLALGDYLAFLVGDETCERGTVVKAFDRMTDLERPLIERYVGWLESRPGVTLVGPGADVDRVATVSFVHESLSSREISDAVDRTDVAIRFGHMYAWHLCEALGLDPVDGVVRASFVHYNTPEEIERLIAALETVI